MMILMLFVYQFLFSPEVVIVIESNSDSAFPYPPPPPPLLPPPIRNTRPGIPKPAPQPSLEVVRGVDVGPWIHHLTMELGATAISIG